jgi:hypothetical protein
MVLITAVKYILKIRDKHTSLLPQDIKYSGKHMARIEVTNTLAYNTLVSITVAQIYLK